MEGMQGSLFRLRTGVDPKVIADIFANGSEAAKDLIRDVNQLRGLLGSGEINQRERLKLTKSAVARAADATPDLGTAGVTGGVDAPETPDWLENLINPPEGVNPHVLLEGQTGSGKTYAARHIAFERMRQGEDVHVVDTHRPESWKGAANVFQGTNAGLDAADLLRETLATRKEETSAAQLAGKEPDFEPMTILFSDFARLMKDTPELGKEFLTLMTEARKFRISVVADTTALTGAATGVEGIEDILQNFGQKVKFYGPTAQGAPRQAEVAGEELEWDSKRKKWVKPRRDVPELPDYKDRIEYADVKPIEPPRQAVEPPFDPMEAAMDRRRGEQRRALVGEQYKQLYGDEEKATGIISSLRHVAYRMRGTIGGLAGTLVGAVLDVMAAVDRAQVQAQRRKKTEDLLAEAHEQISVVGDHKKDETATTNIKKTDASGPGKPTSDLDETTKVLGMGPAVKEVPTKPPKKTTIPTSVPELRRAASKAIGKAMSGAALTTTDKLLILGSATTAVVVAFRALDAAAMGVADRYTQYSGPLSSASALIEARSTINDLRRAQESGPELARYITQRAEIQQKIEDVKLDFIRAALPLMMAFMALFENTLLPTLAAIAKVIKVPMDVISFIDEKLKEILRLGMSMKQAQDLMKQTDLTYAIMNKFVDPTTERTDWNALPVEAGKQRGR